ncbi:MAG: hypothetical protein JWR83_2730, partial [Aeromicrobium sp.]|nr:hypothetical protein [Aeromicrobium sp.]
GLACFVVSLAAPLLDGDKSSFATEGSDASKLLAVIAIPMALAAVLSARSRFLSGLAAGIAGFAGVALGLVWAVYVGLLVNSEFGASVGPGLVAMIAASVFFIAAGLVSMQQREPTPSSPIATLGVVATLTTVAGAMIPTHGTPFKDWMGFSGSAWFGWIGVALLAAFAFVCIAGFRGGRWGLGLVAGFIGEIVIANLAADSGGYSLIDVFARSTVQWHPLATIGFFATAALLVVHVVQTMSNATTIGAPAGGAPAAAPRMPQWSPQQSGPQQSPSLPDADSWWTTPVANANVVPEVDRAVGDVQARWATDPFGRHELRYWNGREWTDHVSDYGIVGTNPARP